MTTADDAQTATNMAQTAGELRQQQGVLSRLCDSLCRSLADEV
jgi:hypothetical protein